MDDLSLLYVTNYDTIRNGQLKKVGSEDLVEGDIILLKSGQQIPADAEVLDGQMNVNESLLTGEADEIEKTAGSELKSGSFAVSGDCAARLTKVGAESYASQLTLKAKKAKTKQGEMIRSIEWIIRIAGIAIIPIGAALLYESLKLKGLSIHDSVISMVGAVIGMIPEGLYLLATVALALSAMRLFNSFKGVTIFAAVISVVCALAGIMFSIVAGTPVGSTIVITEIIAFIICFIIGLAGRRG